MIVPFFFMAPYESVFKPSLHNCSLDQASWLYFKNNECAGFILSSFIFIFRL